MKSDFPHAVSRRVVKTLLIIALFVLSIILCYAEYTPDLLVDEDTWISDQGFDLWDYLGYPVYINTATLYELRRIPGLSDDDLEKIIKAREQRDIRGIDDLRTCGFTDDLIHFIRPYISFRSVTNLSFHHVQRSFYRSVDGEISTRYYQKGELRNSDTIIGFVSMNDYGSSDLTRNNSYYLSHSSDKILQQLVLGRYRLSLGQGVAYAPKTGFSRSSAATTYPVKNYSPLRPHTNPYKNWSLEGIAVMLSLANFDLIPFYSRTKVDASITEEMISTFYPYGTSNNDWRNSVEERIDGVALRYIYRRNSYGIYFSENSFDRAFVNSNMPTRYQTRGVFFFQRLHNFDLFGEYALVGERSGLVTGIRWGETNFRHLLLYRKYEKNIPHWHGNPFSSQTNYDNEEGLYYGMRLRLSRLWTINAFFDIWRHPDTRHFEKMPTTRTEQYLQVIFSKSRDRVRIKMHHKNYDRYRVINDEPKIRSEHKSLLSIDWRHDLTSNFTKISGAEYISRYIPDVKQFRKGILLYENLTWSYRKLRVMYQINVFRSDISHYIYEYSLDGIWDSRPLTGDDLYSYLIIRGEISDALKAEAKLAYFYSGRTKSLITQVICRL